MTATGPKRANALRNLVLLTLVLLPVTACKRHRKSRSAPNSDAYAGQLQTLASTPTLQGMKFPNDAQYQQPVQTFYDDRNYEVAWTRDGKPTAQATAFIKLFQNAAAKGLIADDYDASLWSGRTAKLASGQASADDFAQFDAAMTVSVMRYLSDLHMGRVNPTQFNFDIDVSSKKLDLPTFVSDNVVDAADIPSVVKSVEPDNPQYLATEAALANYVQLAQAQAASPTLSQPLPTVPKALTAGAQYPAAGALEARLQLEGDLPGYTPPAPKRIPPAPKATPAPVTAAAPATLTGKTKLEAEHAGNAVRNAFGKVKADVHAHAHRSPQASAAKAAPAPAPVVPSTVYTAALAQGVQHFQARHALTANGQLTPETIAALNVPLSARAQQLADALERYRWLPGQYIDAPVVVNLPEYVVRTYSSDQADHTLDFAMNAIDGEFKGEHQTPVFVHMIKFVIFRPFWNIPDSILKKDVGPKFAKGGEGYMNRLNLETVDSKGAPVHATADQVIHGQVIVRQKPGPKNALGLIKFMFPNVYDIYMHSTDTPGLFAKSVRDLSHGCVRVQDPAKMGVWIMRNTPGDWDLQKVQDAMNSGPDDHQVNLAQPIPIVIFYATANVSQDGTVHFFNDVYQYDKQMEDVLAKGRPYPTQTRPISPNNSGDTA